MLVGEDQAKRTTRVHRYLNIAVRVFVCKLQLQAAQIFYLIRSEIFNKRPQLQQPITARHLDLR